MIFLAIRYLLERRKQTLLTLFGVFLGTTAYVGVSGFFLGFQGYIVQQLVDNSAQIHIQARQDFLTEHQLDNAFYENEFDHTFWSSPPAGVEGYLEVQNPQGWYERLKADPRVVAYSPLITAPALFTLSKRSVSAGLTGCDPLQQAKVTTISDNMIEGRFTDIAAGGNRVILGDELMKRLGAVVNQTVFVSVGTGPATPYKVVGHFRIGNRIADLQAFGSLGDVQKLNGAPNRVNEIAVKITDYNQAAEIAKSWSKIAPERSESWDQQNANIFSVMKIQNVLRFTMTLTVIIVAGFGVYNVLNMTVNQKRHDIAILRSMGYDTFDIVILFFAQGLILGLCGGSLGLVYGNIVCRYLETIPFMSSMQTSPGGHLHISFSPKIYIQGALLAIISASLASILPARAAGKLTPIEIIRAGT